MGDLQVCKLSHSPWYKNSGWSVLRVTQTPLSITWEAIKKLPDVVTIFVLVSFVFAKWLWRLPIFRGWLIQFPDLQGTWEGTLQSSWVNPETGQGIPPLKVILVIRQTFSSVAATRHPGQVGYSLSPPREVRDEKSST
jgi:hypothetical protein